MIKTAPLSPNHSCRHEVPFRVCCGCAFRRKRSSQMTAERTYPFPLIALVGELRLAQQELPPGERLQLRPIAAISKLRPPRQNPRPSKAAKLIPAGKPLCHFRLGNDQPFPSPSISRLFLLFILQKLSTSH